MSDTTNRSVANRHVADGTESEINLLDLLPVLARRRKFILLGTFGIAILTSIIVLCIHSRYTAEAVVLPPVQNSSMSSALLGELGGSGTLASIAGSSLGIKNPGDLYVSLFRTRTVEDSVIRRFNLTDRYHVKKMSDARAYFDSNSAVNLGVKDGLITVNVTDRDPEMAAAMANGYIDEFRKFSANLAITEAAQRRAFFETQLREANENLLTAEDAMAGTEQSTGVVQIESQTRSLVESAAEVRAQIDAKKVQIQGMLSYATESNPDVIRQEHELAELNSQLAGLSSSKTSTSGLILPKGKVPEVTLEVARKLRDVKYYETIADIVARQFEAAKLDEARQGSAIQIVDVAVVPDKRSYPKRSLTVVIVTFLGFLAICSWFVFSEGLAVLKLQKG